MKKIKLKLSAFSLAEALITLLIVCLITLASIPVLTKKKRSPNELASGKWMCTLNSEGQYVVYSSQDPHGDINNPDTWRTTSSSSGCTFVPPQNAKNFGVTVIGGGGGGHDGVSELYTHLDASKNAFTVSSNYVDSDTDYGTFRLAVIGSGGGGTGSDDEDGPNNRGVGGQGGGGAVWLGEIKLYKGETVSSEIFHEQGVGYDSKSKAGWPGPRTNAGYNKFKINNHVVVQAGSGGGGQATKNSSGADPKGGGGGEGGNLNIPSDSSYKNRLIKPFLVRAKGLQGRSNTNCLDKYSGLKNCATDFGDNYLSETGDLSETRVRGDADPCYGRSNGLIIDNKFYPGNDSTEYGLGGFGCKATKKDGLQASTGTVKLWQIIQRPGYGGSAAKLSYYSFPNIKGKLEITIGKGGAANTDGERTQVTLYNVQGNQERVFYGDGGAAGGTGKLVLKDNASGEVGQNSLWLDKGGGAVGKCQNGGWKTETITVTQQIPKLDENGNPICVTAAYFLGPVDTSAGTRIYTCPLSSTTTPKGACYGCDIRKGIPSGDGQNPCEYILGSTPSNTEMATLIPKGDGAIVYENMVRKLIEGEISFNSLEAKYYGIDKWNHDASAKLLGYYHHTVNYKLPPDKSNGDYYCLEFDDSTVTITTTITKPVYKDEAFCTDSEKGTYFGAGGGGGSASNTVGVFGKGGSGAPGAVIIEW